MRRPTSWNTVGCLLALFFFAASARAQSEATPTEDDYYPIVTLPIPEGIVLEVGGLATMPDGRLAVSTRRGEVWMIQNPTLEGSEQPFFSRFAHGLHEVLGLAFRDGYLYATQRGELTRMRDRDGDGTADEYDSIFSWPLSGNYHEYSYGPLIRPNGNMLVTLNLAWVGHGASLADWRGWMLEITPDGEMTPVATGMRSPAGFGFDAAGELFYAENQGDWIASGYITHVETGDFVGNPAGLRWTTKEGVPARLKGLMPEDIPDTGEPLFEVAERVDQLKPPAVWFPHTIMGISTSDILADTVNGAFGPFDGQLFVGDQGHSKIMRVALEKVNGVYQGAVFPFREGFQSGVLRLAWGSDGSLFVGQTNRGWSSTGSDPYGVQRVVWTGAVPFEVKTVEARPDGFELAFTKPVDPDEAGDPSAYAITSFIYKYHHNYGSPPINKNAAAIRGVEVSDDSMSVRISIDDLRRYHIHELKMAGVRSADGLPLLHDVAYYTLNEIPDGAPMAVEDVVREPETTSPSRAEMEPSRAETGPASTTAKRQITMPAEWTEGADVVKSIGTEPGLQYDVGTFEVAAGSRVQLVFDNDDDMMHNLVIVKPATADAVAEQAMNLGLEGHEKGYVPESDNVLFHTQLLEPHTTETIYFEAPLSPGEYTFVCTFPGHAATMRGTMRVVATEGP